MPVEMLLMTVQGRVADRLAAQRGVEVAALAPEVLTLIVEAVLRVVGRCLEGRRDEAVAARIRAPGLLEELAVRRGVRALLRETHGPSGYFRYRGAELVRALLEAGRAASDEERQELVRQIRRRPV